MARRRTELKLLLLLMLSVCATSAQDLPTDGVNGFSLHPPYFNLAEGTKITATATCGEDEHGRPVQDLYCKLVGGPVSGDPSQTIQVMNLFDLCYLLLTEVSETHGVKYAVGEVVLLFSISRLCCSGLPD